MNPEEKEIAAIILMRCKSEIKRVAHYLQLMRAVKLRLQIEEIVAKQSKEAKK